MAFTPDTRLENAPDELLTSLDLQRIAQTVRAGFPERKNDWTYSDRHCAQAILNFLYLGPTSSIRDHNSLSRNRISSLLVLQDSALKEFRPSSVERAAEALGLQVKYFHVANVTDLVGQLPDIIRYINIHLMSSMEQPCDNEERGSLSPCDPERSKLLVTCASGNNLSAVIATAFIMATLRQEMRRAIRLVQCRRVSCVFMQDEMKALQTWEDILIAQSVVRGQGDSDCTSRNGSLKHSLAVPRRLKRDLEDMMEFDPQESDIGFARAADDERFEDRDSFVPFLDMARLKIGLSTPVR
ncbi:Dual specificity phosphatase, catalytic domain protein [Moelleriella libera RCEF 2490]|uniref:Dual specificity phosphatase, catalytic domain protein n=1 Tax=Moelleriella libera RCEF 2490 TaxID=1081109 RepID=A0A168BHC4_9HYPO|nr:Dual specificity phosphatase, catalytic domain protein [Moelleriella libera RCEF 2490]